MNESCRSNDLVAKRWSFWLFWGFPQLVMLAAVFVEESLRMTLWIVSLLTMGLACLYNARQCMRRHCRITGPFFIIGAIVTLAVGMRWVDLGLYAWFWLGGTLIIAGYSLAIVPDRIVGRYADQ